MGEELPGQVAVFLVSISVVPATQWAALRLAIRRAALEGRGSGHD